MSLEETLERFVRQVGHWEAARWAGERAETVHGLVQWVADRGAEAEGRPLRRVPRLGNDLALTDQLRVVVADLVAASPDPAVTAEAAARLNAVRHAL